MLVHVDGHQTHLQVLGAESDGPTVVLEAGMGSFSPTGTGSSKSLLQRSEALPMTVQGSAGAGAAANHGTPRRSPSSCAML